MDNLIIGDIIYYKLIDYMGFISRIENKDIYIHSFFTDDFIKLPINSYGILKIDMNYIKTKIIIQSNKSFIYPYIMNKDLKAFGKFLEEQDDLLSIRKHVWRKLNHYKIQILNKNMT